MDVDVRESILKNAPLGYALIQIIEDEKGIPIDYTPIEMNQQMESFAGFPAPNVIGQKASSFITSFAFDNFDSVQILAEIASTGEQKEFAVYSKSLDKWGKVIAYSPKKGYVVVLVDDVTMEMKNKKQYLETRQVVKRQENIIDIYNKNIDDQKEFLTYVLHAAQELLKSEYGYIFLFVEDKGELIQNGWTGGVLHDCKVDEKDQKTIYQLEETGIWGEAVRQGQPIIMNDFLQDHPLKRGFPAGHIALKNFMSIPVFFNEKIVATVGLANKDEDYTEFDANELMLLMQSAWFVKEAKVQAAKKEEERIKNKQILNRLPVLFCEFDQESKLTYVNENYCAFFNLDYKDIIGKSFLDFIPEREKETVKDRYLSLTPENPCVQYMHQFDNKDGTRWMEWQDVAVFGDEKRIISYYSIGHDITDRKLLEMKELEELEQFRSAIENHGAIIFIIDPENWQILYVNAAAVDFYGYTKDELLTMNIQDINMLGMENIEEFLNFVKESEEKFYTYPNRLKNGEIRMVDVFTSYIDYNHKKALFCTIFDVTEKEKAMSDIWHLAYHDELTGVYNRRYFHESFLRLDKMGEKPLAIIMGDINGMKIVNDNYGHLFGDRLIKEATKNIQKYIPEDSFLARVGGDEFVIVIPKANEKNLREITENLEKQLDRGILFDKNGNAELYLSISFGYSIQSKNKQRLDDLLKQAESYVYKRKYYCQRSARSHIVKAMMSTLFSKSEREQRHSERVGAYCAAIAKALNCETMRISEMKVAGDFHDIGKIGIDGNILNKEGRLNEEEWEVMKQHPEKSAKILGEIEEYRDILDIVSAHHERVDGTGYPKGLKGKDIPFEAKIISVADAYDAMTEYRTYKKAKSKDEAIAELYRCSGTQFDPQIVDVFVNKVLLRELNEKKRKALFRTFGIETKYKVKKETLKE